MSNRNNLDINSPGVITWDGAKFWSNSIKSTLTEQFVDVTMDHHGRTDKRLVGRLVKVTFAPQLYTTAAIAKLFPHQAVRNGGSIIPSTDKPITINTVDGRLRTIPCGFIYGEPALNCACGKTVFGEVTMYGILGIDDDPATLASYYARSSSAWPGESTFDPSKWITPAWDISWTGGEASAWDAIDTEDGLVITPQSSLQELVVNGKGLIDVRINGYKCMVKGKTMNITEDLVLAALGDIGMGASAGSRGREMALNSTDGAAFIRVYNAVLQPDYVFSMDAQNRVVGELTWEALPAYSTGAVNNLLLVTDTDPDA